MTEKTQNRAWGGEGGAQTKTKTDEKPIKEHSILLARIKLSSQVIVRGIIGSSRGFSINLKKLTFFNQKNSFSNGL